MWRNPFGIRSRGFANNTGLLGNGKPWVKAYGPSRVGAKEPSVLLGHGKPWVKRRPLHTRSAVARAYEPWCIAATPLGLCGFTAYTQGSFATLGYVAESLWDSFARVREHHRVARQRETLGKSLWSVPSWCERTFCVTRARDTLGKKTAPTHPQRGCAHESIWPGV